MNYIHYVAVSPLGVTTCLISTRDFDSFQRHGVDRINRYYLGAVLLDGDEPWRVLARSPEPIFEPEVDYERQGFFGNVVFMCGLLCEDDMLKIYYGAADTSICHAELSLREILVSLNP